VNQRPVLRRCIACRQLLNRQQLWRVIRDHQEGVVLDQGIGRSAYLCQNEACLDEAHRHKRLQKALRCQVPKSVVEVLRKRLNHTSESAAEAI